MLRWAVLFLVFALVAAIFGFTNIAGEAVDMAKVLFFVFLALFVIGVAFGFRRGPSDVV